MRLNEITNSTEKLELLRLIDAAIWQAFDTERLYAEDEPTDAQDKMAQSVAATPAANQNANQHASQPIAKQPTQKPAKQLTPTQQAHVKTLNPKQLAQYIKTHLNTSTTPKPVAPTPKAAPKPLNTQSTDTIGTFNPKTDMDKNKAGEPDRQA